MKLIRGFCIFWILFVQLSVFQCTSDFDKTVQEHFQDYISDLRIIFPPHSRHFADLNSLHCPDNSYPQHWDSHCGKQCQDDRDCLYREESCLCDGYCGLTCVRNSRIKCSAPPYVPNAKHDGSPYQKRFVTRTSLHYSCKPGFKLNTDANEWAWCVGRGKRDWEGPNMTCTPIAVDCPILSAPVSGSKNESETAQGRVITFECDDGFKNTGSSERLCLADGTWSGQPAICEENDCGWPEILYNGYLIGYKTTVGSIIFFSCNPRTTFEGASLRTQCLPNGEWSDRVPICWGQCQIPVVPNAVFLEGQGEMYVDHGIEIQYQCQVGFVPRTASSMRCLNGTWTPTAECIPTQPCDFPGDIEHGWLKVQYYCHDGYELIGVDDRMCQPNGQWNGTKPVCKPVTCPSLVSPVNGHMEGLGTVYGTIITFRCDEGFKNKGSSERKCLADGTWSGHEAVCEGM